MKLTVHSPTQNLTKMITLDVSPFASYTELKLALQKWVKDNAHTRKTLDHLIETINEIKPKSIVIQRTIRTYVDVNDCVFPEDENIMVIEEYVHPSLIQKDKEESSFIILKSNIHVTPCMVTQKFLIEELRNILHGLESKVEIEKELPPAKTEGLFGSYGQ